MKKAQPVGMLLFVFLFMILVLMWGANAGADVSLSQNEKLKVDLYGQVNRAVLFVDDGNTNEFYHADNDNSSTRLGFKVSAPTTDKLTAGANIEFEYQANPSNFVWQNDPNYKTDPDANRLDKRILEVYLNSSFGKLSVGHGSTASDGSSEVDLSGTSVAGYSEVRGFGGGMRFYDNRAKKLDVYSAKDAAGNTVNDAKKDVSINNVYNNLDGLSRKDRLRYDTPKLAGFQLAVSTYAESIDDAEDVAVSYVGELGGHKLSAAASYVYYNNASANKYQYSGSLSFLTGFGLNLTAAAGNLERRDVTKPDANFYYGKVGYIANLFSVGTSNFAVEYGTFNDFQNNEDRANATGVLFVQNLKDWSTELYLGYRYYELNRCRDSKGKYVPFDYYSDIQAAMAGMRLKF